MCVPNRKPNAMSRAGLALLCLASACRLLLMHQGPWGDGLAGFLYGLSITLLVGGLILKRRAQNG